MFTLQKVTTSKMALTRKQVKTLLANATACITAGKLEEAEQHLTEAQSAGPLEDDGKKVLQQLQDAKAALEKPESEPDTKQPNGAAPDTGETKPHEPIEETGDKDDDIVVPKVKTTPSDTPPSSDSEMFNLRHMSGLYRTYGGATYRSLGHGFGNYSDNPFGTQRYGNTKSSEYAATAGPFGASSMKHEGLFASDSTTVEDRLRQMSEQVERSDRMLGFMMQALEKLDNKYRNIDTLVQTQNIKMLDEVTMLCQRQGYHFNKKITKLEKKHQKLTETLGEIQDGKKPNVPVKPMPTPRKPLSVKSDSGSSGNASTSSESEQESDAQSKTGSTATRRAKSKYRKLPPYKGTGRWDVWHNRFKDIAKRENWSNEDCLDEILPLLQGSAGEFVFGQLSEKIRGQYQKLIAELENRFRVVETSKTYAAKFSKRMQGAHESVEDFCADLKKLYDKAYPNRDSATRTEDLLRRFLDGLNDDKARFHVEYIKEPKNIDQAVYEVVLFQHTRENKSDSKKRTRVLKLDSESESDEEKSSHSDSGVITRRVPDKQFSKSKTSNGNNNKKSDNTQTGLKDLEDLNRKVESLTQLVSQLNTTTAKQTPSKKNGKNKNQRKGKTKGKGQYQNPNQFQPFQQFAGQWPQFTSPWQPTSKGCFKCGSMDHWQANCKVFPTLPNQPSIMMQHPEQENIIHADNIAPAQIMQHQLENQNGQLNN